MLAAALLIATQPTPQAERLGVCILAAISGVLVCGLISLVKEMRAETSARP
ncbi:MAG: hypothetical protein IPO30_00710 [Hyphomonadaceae bacterium]|nr:hypothetical protein [Hyphomonadaceae bacterium]